MRWASSQFVYNGFGTLPVLSIVAILYDIKIPWIHSNWANPHQLYHDIFSMHPHPHFATPNELNLQQKYHMARPLAYSKITDGWEPFHQFYWHNREHKFGCKKAKKQEQDLKHNPWSNANKSTKHACKIHVTLRDRPALGVVMNRGGPFCREPRF